MKIKEIIVVEGKSDTAAVKNAVDADTIETNGSAVGDTILEKIALAQQKRGVIILTDPDFPGERIRKIVSGHVPGCKHAFVLKAEAMSNHVDSLGVEHASPTVIRQALQAAKTDMLEEWELIQWQDLVDLGLIGGSQAKRRRESLGKLLGIGYANGKQLHKRLKMFQTSREEFLAAYEQTLQEEQE